MIPDLHIVFGDSAAGTLKAALRELGIQSYRDKVVTFSDNFSIGPIWQLHQEKGLQNRLEWLNTHLTHEPADEFEIWYSDSFRLALNRIDAVKDDTSVLIWIGNNAHDQTGMRFALHLLQGRKIKVYLANVTETYRERYKRFDPLHLGEIVHDKLIELIQVDQLIQPLSDNARIQLEQEWLSLANSQAELRIWKDDRIHIVSADYFDECLIRAAQHFHTGYGKMDFMKSARLIGEVLGRLEQYVGDEFLEYRLRELIQKGVFLMEGSLEAMRFYSVKLNHN